MRIWDYYTESIYKIQLTDTYVKTISPRQGGQEFVEATTETVKRGPIYCTALDDFQYLSGNTFLWTEEDYRLYWEYGVFGLCPSGGRWPCDEPDGTSPTGTRRYNYLHRIALGTVMRPPTESNGGASNTNAFEWRLGEYNGSRNDGVAIAGRGESTGIHSTSFSIQIVAWYGLQPPFLGPWEGDGDGPFPGSGPQGPYICEPCPDRECLAPANAATLNDILDRLDQLGQGEWVDLSPIVKSLDERVKSIERLTIGFRQGRKEAVTRLSLAKQTATAELTATENARNAFNQVLATLLASDYAGTLFAELNDLLANITLALSSPALVELDYSSTCDEGGSDRVIIQGTRLEVMSSSWPALASMAEATDCKIKEFAPVAAWPEWWGTRQGASSPQVVTLYAPKDRNGNWLSGRYPVTVPHASQAAPVKSFWKGPYQGRLILSDNSDLIVCCRSQGDASALISQLRLQIPASLRRESHESYGKTTAGIGTEKVWRKLSAYFPNGQLSREPEWVKHYE